MPSPVGELLLTMCDGRLTSLFLPAHAHEPPAGAVRDNGALAAARKQLEQYFAGERQAFDLPLAAHGTPFRQRVWEELQRVGYGETISYGELAERSGRPGAARAAGSANGANPISIVIPCHRVIGATGALTGYGGGLDAKRYLLALERSRA
jgi:methylated-DNA-[protein]-cysteine S-methyltransferase